MLASLEWLKQYVDINIPTDVLVDKITRAGLEVETVKKARVLVTRFKKLLALNLAN